MNVSNPNDNFKSAVKDFAAECVVPTGIGIFSAQAHIARKLLSGELPTPTEAAQNLAAEMRFTEPTLRSALGKAGITSHVVGIVAASAAYWVIRLAREGGSKRDQTLLKPADKQSPGCCEKLERERDNGQAHNHTLPIV